jgi:hypothetical protein
MLKIYRVQYCTADTSSHNADQLTLKTCFLSTNLKFIT